MGPFPVPGSARMKVGHAFKAIKRSRSCTAPGLTPGGEQLLEAQSIAVVVIIIPMPAEKSVARFFVARNRPRVVLMNFETHRLAGRGAWRPPRPPPATMARGLAAQGGERLRWNKGGRAKNAVEKAPAHSRRGFCRRRRRRSARRSATPGNGADFVATAGRSQRPRSRWRPARQGRHDRPRRSLCGVAAADPVTTPVRARYARACFPTAPAGRPLPAACPSAAG